MSGNIGSQDVTKLVLPLRVLSCLRLDGNLPSKTAFASVFLLSIDKMFVHNAAVVA